MTTVAYIHGFNSSPDSTKGRAIRAFCESKGYEFIGVEYDCKAGFDDNLTRILNQIPDADVVVGSSLGGCYALRVAALLGCQCVLINPSLEPRESLAKYGLPEEVRNTYTEAVKSQWGTISLLAYDDEVIPYKTYFDFLYSFSEVRVFPRGGHQFDNPEAINKAIEDIINWAI